MAASIWAVMGESKVAVKELDEVTLNISRGENSWNVLVDEQYATRMSGLVSGSIYYLGTLQDESFARDVLAIASSVKKLIFEDLAVRDMEVQRPTSFGPSDDSLIEEGITPPTSEVSMDNPQLVDDVSNSLSMEVQQPEAAEMIYGGDGTFPQEPAADPSMASGELAADPSMASGDPAADPSMASGDPALTPPAGAPVPPADPSGMVPMPPQLGGETRTNSIIASSLRYVYNSQRKLREASRKGNMSARELLNLQALMKVDRLLRRASALFPSGLPNGTQNVGGGQLNTPAPAAPAAPAAAPAPAKSSPMTLNIGTPPTNNPAPKADNENKHPIGGQTDQAGERTAATEFVDPEKFQEKFREGSVGIQVDETNGLLKIRGFHEPNNLGKTLTTEVVLVRREASSGEVHIVSSVGKGWRGIFASSDPKLAERITNEVAALGGVAKDQFVRFLGE